MTDIIMKQITLKGWKIIKDTGKCILVEKKFSKNYPYTSRRHIPKKYIELVRE